MLTFVKLGGSLITDKRAESSFRAETAARIASEIQSALTQDNSLRLLIGHGSGSFGHVAAKRYGTMQGVLSFVDWMCFVYV
jgi:isopentenyl phosphate kinase